LSASCICGSDLWPFRGENDVTEPKAMGHEYCGVVQTNARDQERADETEHGTHPCAAEQFYSIVM